MNLEHISISCLKICCRRIPRDMYEDELIPMFEKYGTIWEISLLMDPLTNLNRGYAFVKFTTAEAAHAAVSQVIIKLSRYIL